MSKVTEIEQGNRIIAEFDGWSYYEKEPIEESCWSKKGVQWVSIDPPEFNNDWNLLMHVVEKIQSIYVNTEVRIWKNVGGYAFALTHGNKYKQEWANTDYLINSAWQAVVQFIEFHNNTQKL